MKRIGVLSAVRHAADYLQLLSADPRVQIVGIAEDSELEWIREDSRAVAERFGIAFFEDADALLAPGVCDAVIVCSEPTRHAALAVRALEADLDVLVDKPLAVSVEEADAVIAAEAASRGTASVVNRTGSPAMARMRGWIDAGHLGLPLHVDVEWFASGAHFSTSVERPELVNDPALSGGGELLNFLLYPVDYVRHLTGLEVTSVYAQTSTLFQEGHRQQGVEDCGIVSLGLQNGVSATITLGRVAAAPGHGPVSSSVRVIGSRGFATADDDQPAVSVFGTDGAERQEPMGGPSSVEIVRTLLSEWVNNLETGRSPRYGLEDARASLLVTQRSYDSARSGQPESLPGSDRAVEAVGPEAVNTGGRR